MPFPIGGREKALPVGGRGEASSAGCVMENAAGFAAAQKTEGRSKAMRKFKNFVIGGIQSKVFNLILYTVFLLTAAFIALSIYQNNTLSQLVADSSQKQQEAIGEITGRVMDVVVDQSLERTNHTEAAIVDAMFTDEARRVLFLADYATKVFAHPEAYEPKPYSGPRAEDDGKWTAKVIYAPGVDPEDPAVKGKLGLVANMAEIMLSLCPSYEATSIYIGLPEGAHLTIGNTSSGWISESGGTIAYDPRERGWYRAAVEAGKLTFFGNETDIDTGAFCVECAIPVYGPDGSLQAVIGTDLFLDNMQQILQGMSVEGEYFLLINQNGYIIPGPQSEIFPISAENKTGDMREAGEPLLRDVVSQALAGSSTAVVSGAFGDGTYYLTASPIPSTGWVLVSAYNAEITRQPAQLLQGSVSQIQSESMSVYQTKMSHSRTMANILLLVVMVLTLTGALVLGKRIVKPLNTITRRISELSEGNLEFKMEGAYKTGDEVEELAQSFAAISHKTVEYMQKIVQVTAEKERIGTELALATQIQGAMLPHIFPAFPDRSEFDIFASMDPAKEVGGDFYDYFLIDNDHLGLVIADVSGKGVPAALFMMASKIILQSVAMMGHSPAEILARTNNAIYTNNEAEMFVTVWLGILELSTGKLTAANAGHEFPALRQPGAPFELYKDRHGFVIGGMENVRYKEYQIQMEPGSKIFVYTDGVAEATNAEKELFGTERMIEALNTDPDATPQQILKNVRSSVDAFVKDAEQFDDLTMLCLEYKGKR